MSQIKVKCDIYFQIRRGLSHFHNNKCAFSHENDASFPFPSHVRFNVFFSAALFSQRKNARHMLEAS